MQFLYPKFLWALLTVSIPIIIHLFNFRKYKTVYFSNVKFLQNIRRETKSKSTLKNILLLLFRIFAIAFMVFAFAKPQIPINNKVLDQKEQQVVIYVDNSFSMAAEGKFGMLLENAKTNAKNITEAFPYNTRYLLLTNDFDLKHHQLVSRDQLVDWVSEIETSHVHRTINNVVEKSASILNLNDTNTMVQYFLLSDFQDNIFDSYDFYLPDNHKVYTINHINNQKNNLLIDSIRFESPGHYKGKQENLFVYIRNASNTDYEDIPLNLYINDTLKSSISFSVISNGKQIVEIPFVQWNAGINKAYVQISDFPIVFDNEYHFNWTIKDKIQVLLINETKSRNNRYIETLLKNDNNFELSLIDRLSVQYDELSNFQLVVLNELDHISTGLISEIDNYSKNGGQALIVPSNEIDIKQYNSLINKAGGISISGWIDQKGSITKIDDKNEILKLTLKGDLNKVKFPDFTGYYKIRVVEKSLINTILYNEGNNGMFFQIPNGSGQFFVSALPLNEKVTDFGTHPLFVPLFYNIALHSNFQQNNSYWLKPNSFVTLKKQQLTSNSIIIQNENISLLTRFVNQSQQLRLYPEISKLTSGAFDVISNDIHLGIISFNFDRNESELNYLSKDDLQSKLSNLGVKNLAAFTSGNSVLVNEIESAYKGKDLSWIMLWMVIVFLLGEMLVVRFIK